MMLTARDLRLTEQLNRVEVQAVLQDAPEMRYLLKYASILPGRGDRQQVFAALRQLVQVRVTDRGCAAVLDALDRLLPDENERSA